MISPALRILASPRPVVIGHRGYALLAPENTLPSFELALTAGADLVELDARPSRDGQLMVVHDAELDRTTDAPARWGGRRIRVESRWAEDLHALDAGSWFDRRFAGTRVPSLQQALDTIQPRAVTLIERKGGDAAAYVELLREKDLVNRVIIQSFDWEFLREFHELEPAQVLGALGPPSILAFGKKRPALFRGLNGGWLQRLEESGARVVVWNKQVSKGAVRLAHQRGFKVWVYTIDTATLALRLLERGVDGLITNNTALMWKVMALKRKLQVPNSKPQRTKL